MPLECHRVETMAYAMRSTADVPWHGIGEPVIPGTGPEMMQQQAGLNWTVSKRPAFIPVADALGKYLEDKMAVEDYFFLVRDSDQRVLGPAGKEYVPTQNHELFVFLKKFTDAGQMTIETAGSLQNGKIVWVLAALNLGFTLPGNDETRSYLLISSPHIWGKSLTMKFTTIRTVCWNTYTLAMREATDMFRMRHIKTFDADIMKQAETVLGLGKKLTNQMAAEAEMMSKTRLSANAVARYVADVVQPELVAKQYGVKYTALPSIRQAEFLLNPLTDPIDVSQFKRTTSNILTNVNQQPGAALESSEGTVWGGFNAVTHYFDHIAGRNRDNALYSAWFDKTAVIKEKAYARAVQFSKLNAIARGWAEK